MIARGINTINDLIDILDTTDQVGELNSYRAVQFENSVQSAAGRQRFMLSRNQTYNGSIRAPDIRTSTPRNMTAPGRNMSANWREERLYRQSNMRQPIQVGRGASTNPRSSPNINQINLKNNESAKRGLVTSEASEVRFEWSGISEPIFDVTINNSELEINTIFDNTRDFLLEENSDLRQVESTSLGCL